MRLNRNYKSSARELACGAPAFVAAAVLAFLLLAVSASAHHGGTQFDIDKKVSLEGTIAQLEFVNPHVRIHVDVKSSNGQVVRWALETYSPVVLSKLGWTKNTLKPGDHVTLIAYPAKNGLPAGALNKVFLADGRELPLKGEIK